MRNKGALLVCVFTVTVTVSAMEFGDWEPAVSLESIPGTHDRLNTEFQDGCPATSRDGLNLFMASNRPGGLGGLDLWVVTRESADDPWGEPINLGAPINTAADEFCPTPLVNGHELLFVSTKAGGCGGSDIYLARRHERRRWQPPVHLGCEVNSAGDEASPMMIEYERGRRELYFSSTRAGGFAPEPPGTVADADIYASPVEGSGAVGAPVLAAGLNTTAQDARPMLRRDGLEIVFDSTRAGGFGGFDVWSATRSTPSAEWGAPTNAGPNVNSAANETRPFLSWGGTVLYFGTTRPGVEGVGDIWIAKRGRRGGE